MQMRDGNVSDTRKLISGQLVSTGDTTQPIPILEMPPQLIPLVSPTLSVSLEDFLANLFQMLESGEDLKILRALCFLRYVESYGLRNHAIYCLRTSIQSYGTIKLKHFKPSLDHWMNWGMMRNGKCLTADVTESPKTEREFSLSEIFEELPPPIYFLSEKRKREIINNTIELRKKNYGYQPCPLSITRHLGKVHLSKIKDNTGYSRPKNLKDCKDSPQTILSMDCSMMGKLEKFQTKNDGNAVEMQ